MMKLFHFHEHIGKFRVLIQTRDINDKAITGRKIADRVIDWFHIIKKAIRNEHIADKAVNARTLADKAVTTDKIKDGAVTPEKLSDRIVPEVIKPLIDPLHAKDKDLQHQIESLVAGSSVPITNEFGDSEWLVVSQKALAEAFNKVWGKMEEITGESLKGFTLIVTPEYYIGEDGCTVHISASSAETAGRFEYIKFYINNILITEAEDVESLEYTTTVNETCEVKCVAKILGIEYTETKILTHYNSIFLGASTSYTNIMNVAHVISINNGMKGNYSVPCNDGDHIYVVIGKSLRDGFARADMNGVEIQFNETEVTVGGKEYVVFTSKGTIERGTYNIDINS